MTCDPQYRKTYQLFHFNVQLMISGGSRNLRTGERGPGAVYFLRSGDCFDVLSHIPYSFVVRVKNKKHIISIAC